jgi:cobalt transporter subunit CbtB
MRDDAAGRLSAKPADAPILERAAAPPSTAERPQAEGRSRLVAPLAAAALGLVLIYAAGFAQPEAIHNAAHDARHAAGFPCH